MRENYNYVNDGKAMEYGKIIGNNFTSSPGKMTRKLIRSLGKCLWEDYFFHVKFVVLTSPYYVCLFSRLRDYS